MDLIIVESPTKAKTLSSFLKKEYQIKATWGHVRDLPVKKLGVDVEGDFEPVYVVIPNKKKRVAELKKIAKKAKKIILATDLDREGEAIAYHTAVLLASPNSRIARMDIRINSKKKFESLENYERIVFHEITKSAIDKALKNPRPIDMKLVDAQQARRVLDRLVGYKLSPLLWKKLGRQWLSAGRVQSITVRLIVERERERKKFKEEEYWKIGSRFQVLDSREEIEAELKAKNEEKYEEMASFDLFDGKYKISKTIIKNKDQAEQIIGDFKNNSFQVTSLDQKEVRRFPSAPFTTSTLQQNANLRLGFSSRRTMSLAQKLYEKGLITYHRTDSVFLSESFLTSAQKFIEKIHGKKYALDKPRRFKTKSKLAQEAHEAIRPTELVVQGSRFEVRGKLTKDHLKLYELIFKRAVASQAREAVVDTTKVGVLSSTKYLFEARGSVIKFNGFLKIIGTQFQDKILPELKVGQALKLIESIPSQHLVKPPPRYNEASLVKTLEKSGIGRPSTYAPTISTILTRQYVEKIEGRFAPTVLGESVNDFLVKNFPEIDDIPFTAQMEDDLDEIAMGRKEWRPIIKEFYTPFEKKVKKVNQTAKKIKLPVEETKEKCPKCKAKIVIKIGRFGKFLSCSAFPKCDYTASFLEKVGIKCPECKADLVIKKTKKGKRFYGCSNWPKCNFASWTKPKVEKKV